MTRRSLEAAHPLTASAPPLDFLSCDTIMSCRSHLGDIALFLAVDGSLVTTGKFKLDSHHDTPCLVQSQPWRHADTRCQMCPAANEGSGNGRRLLILTAVVIIFPAAIAKVSGLQLLLGTPGALDLHKTP